ncbi:MAG: long-chain fatty acid--CoA ligase [Sandaracinaceae bacterium]
MTATMMDYPLTTNHIVERAAREFPRTEVLSQMPDKSLRRHTYVDLRDRSRALAKALLDAGLSRGDRIATLMWNHHAHLETYYAAGYCGGVYHTLNLRLSPGDLSYIANHAKDRFLVVDDVLFKLYQAFAKDAPFEKVIVVSLTGQPVPDGTVEYEAFLEEGKDPAWTPPPADENDGVGMCYTSGTTGRPKGVIYSHRATVLHSFASVMMDTLAISMSDTVLPVVPMFHANAWGLPFSCALVGARQVHPGPHLDPESLLDLYEREKVTMSAGVPTIWIGIQKAMEANPGRWTLQPGLRMVVGGSAAPEAMIRSMDALGMRVVHAWGMTEMSPLGTVSTVKPQVDGGNEDRVYEVRAKQGFAAPFVDVRAVGEKGEVPWDGQSMGELQVRGPWVAGRYHDFPEADDKWTDDGWFRTGDVVTIDPDGYMKITDRTKDLIKSGGEWISSVDMENYLMGHPSIQEAAVIAVPHPRWVERPLAVVVPKEGQSLDEKALEAYLLEKFPKWWVPEAFAVREEIPRGATGKFLKSALRDEYETWSEGSGEA